MKLTSNQKRILSLLNDGWEIRTTNIRGSRSYWLHHDDQRLAETLTYKTFYSLLDRGFLKIKPSDRIDVKAYELDRKGVRQQQIEQAVRYAVKKARKTI